MILAASLELAVELRSPENPSFMAWWVLNSIHIASCLAVAGTLGALPPS